MSEVFKSNSFKSDIIYYLMLITIFVMFTIKTLNIFYYKRFFIIIFPNYNKILSIH